MIRNFRTEIVAGLLACLGLGACSLFPTTPVLDAERQSIQARRLAEAELALRTLERTDVVVRLDNALLREAILGTVDSGLNKLTGWSEGRVSVDFLPQFIALEARGRFGPDGEDGESVTVQGDAQLRYHAGRLTWHPRFTRVVVRDDVIGAEPNTDPELIAAADRWLTWLNASLSNSLRAGGENAIELSPLPLGILETGIRLSAPFEAVSFETSVLEGALTTAGAAVLIEPDATHLALDLGFVPGLPDCRARVAIDRVTFARAIRDREPVDPVSQVAKGEETGVLFTEIVGATAPTSVVHYWFADGRPASVAELEVQPSARWRTWSARPLDDLAARYWDVLLVEKSTGCILGTHSIIVEDPERDGHGDRTRPETVVDGSVFETYAARFRTVAGIDPETRLTTAPATIDVSRPFFREALSAALYDVRLLSRPEVLSAVSAPIDARVEALPAGLLSCEGRQCDSDRVCTLDYNRCPIRRDTRDCTSCLIRNPLNNRCMKEAEDPICVAARDTENARLAEERQACVARETARRDACLAARDRELASCRRTARNEIETCRAQVDEMASLADRLAPLATLEGSARFTGELVVEFSEFRLQEDLQRMRMVLGLSADLEVGGKLDFQPAPELGPLGGCLQSATDDFRAQLALQLWQSGLIGELESMDEHLQVDWSGLVHRFEVDPAPVSVFFEEHPGILEDCQLGLEPRLLPGSLSGAGTDLLRGWLTLDMQPAPTRITLLPAYLRVGHSVWAGDARVGDTGVRYTLTARETGPPDRDRAP